MKKYEKEMVEDYITETLQNNGWEFVENKNLERESIREPLLVENFKKAILKINKDLSIGEEEINKVINEIKLLPSGQEGIKRFLHFLKYAIAIKFEKEKIVKYVNLIDYENPENNEFIFSRQVHFRGKDLIIPDIILYINGIPLLEIECKNPLSLRTGWEEGYHQIKNYEKIFPELYKYIQVGISFAEKARYFPIVPWQDDVYKYVWKKDDLPEDEAIFEFLSPSVIVDILRNFLFIREEHGEVKKVICRYMQYRAVNKIYKRVIENLEGKETKNKGLIWHWQGSGKTLTMIFATHKLYFHPLLGKPTIFIIVDRRELEEQMKLELSSLKLNFDFEEVDSVKKLKEILSYNDFKGKRGIFLTLIHKFRSDEKFLPEEINNSVSQRKNVICFLDEVHRSQYGLLAGQMKNVLKNAFYFGFTGTPIAEDERNTYTEFGYPLKDEGYIDKYFLDNSQIDGFTLPLIYQSRMEKEVHLKEEDIKLFIEKVESDDIDEIEKEKINEGVRKKLNYINVFLENENRIFKISEDISKHFKENVDGKFKGMVVCGSRKSCVLYKKYLDRYLPEDYSEVVMSFNKTEREPIKSFYNQWQQKYKEFPDDEKRIKYIIENYKEKEYPKILIVTNMLITGFDAPILQTMYLDKLLKKHRLLQAIARTNRPYDDIKPFGLIVDYVGILNYLNEALKYYYKSEVKGIIMDYSYAILELEEIIKNLEKNFAGIEFKITRDTLKKVLELLRDEERKKEFIENYKKARKIFEILGSYSEKLKFLEKFKFFTAIYEYWKKISNEKEREKINKIFKKTLSVIHQNMQFKNIVTGIPEIPLDIKYFEKIKNSSLSREEKAVNILFALEKFILVEKRNTPVYMSIVDRLKDLIRKWKEKKIDITGLWEEDEELIKEVNEIEKRRENLGLSEFEFGIFIILKEFLKNKSDEYLKEIVEEIKNLIKDDLIENWRENKSLKLSIERKTREYLLEVKNKNKLSYEEFDTLHRQIISYINEYSD